MSNTYFRHKSLHKCTRVAKGQDGVEIKSMIDLVLVKKDMLYYEYDGDSQITIFYCVKLMGACIKRRESMDGARWLEARN